MNIKKEDIENIEFVLENCECIIAPIECFESLNIINDDIIIFDDCTLDKFECTITYKEGLDYSFGFTTTATPLQRLNTYNDIVYIIIKLKTGEDIKCYMPWYESENGYDSQSNENQVTSLKNHKEIYIKVETNSKEYTLQEIFNLPDGARFVDEDNKEYTLCRYDGISCIPNTMLTDKIIHTKFKLL